MRTRKELKGNWATLLLATDKVGNLDIPRMEEEIDVLIASSPNGIYSNGTAGEFYTQDRDEYVRISGILAGKCKAAGVDFQIGASHPCAQESLWRLNAVKDLRPFAVQVILPDWFPVDDRAAISFMKKMAEEAGDIPLVLYNPPHAKKVLGPEKWQLIRKEVPSLIGVKVFDDNCSPDWYERMRRNSEGIAVFVPGHHLATGYMNGASGAYSNVACLNPFAAQKWYDLMTADLDSALELESRINVFMKKCIDPFIAEMHYPNHACDRFMALVGGWADVGADLRWPYSSIPEGYVSQVRKEVENIIPEFLMK